MDVAKPTLVGAANVIRGRYAVGLSLVCVAFTETEVAVGDKR